jgi:transposase
MATRETFKLTQAERRRRIFSEDFKRQKVREIDLKQTTIAAVSKAFEVRYSNVVKWVCKYSTTYKRGIRLVVEMESETQRLISLQAKIAELERIIGQKQVIIDFQDKMIELAEESYGIDIKKKFDSKPLSTSGTSGNDSPSV